MKLLKLMNYSTNEYGDETWIGTVVEIRIVDEQEIDLNSVMQGMIERYIKDVLWSSIWKDCNMEKTPKGIAAEIDYEGFPSNFIYRIEVSTDDIVQTEKGVYKVNLTWM